MGISSSTVTAGIKNQVDGKNNALYQLADVKGNGKLALLAKKTLKTSNVSVLDEMIREVLFLYKFLKYVIFYCFYTNLQHITPFLYNEGNGELLPIEEVISFRHKERTGIFFYFI